MGNKNKDTIIRHIGSSTMHNPKPTKNPSVNETLGGMTKTNVSTKTPKKGK